ncbi:hypothetical protein EDB92DRAFT_1865425 [Lactarius akahatsu]|uniref:Uncharacterized protein n=1 Tax=Lactarius akahatsu TaxID=416441 RepID=A0AAD4LG02_9AGAM|nr:hypothetical protein EDB92DRAFT_1865425 [Lactarius akahatsu]
MKEFEGFVAYMSAFFDSHAAPNATPAILSLLSEQSSSEPILGSRLRELLDTCLPSSSLLTKEQRKTRLYVCLKCLWCCVRTYNKKPEVPLAPYVRAIFASPEVIHRIQTEQDVAIRLLGLCFGSLVVKKLANDITSPSRTSFATITAEMASLPHVLGTTREQVNGWLGQEGAIDLANVISLASAGLEALVDSGTKGVPTDVVNVFELTLSILAEGIESTRTNANVEWDTDHVARFHEIHPEFANARVPDLLKERLWHILDRNFTNARVPDLFKDRLRHISDRFPPSSYVEEAKMEMPSPELYLDSETTPSPGMSQKLREVQVRFGGAPDDGFVDGSG